MKKTMVTSLLLLAALLGPVQGWAQNQGSYQVLAHNDLGMHCYDASFGTFAILPLYNVLKAQTLLKGTHPQFLDSTQVNLTYQAVADPSGSINTTSRNKTNFWAYVKKLFGVSLPINVGLKRARMPGPTNVPQPLGVFDLLTNWFAAEGIPITAIDDGLKRNTLPLMQVSATDKSTGAVLATLDTVVPTSDEMNCSNCHITGGQAANQATAQKYGITAWSVSINKATKTKENILILHDAVNDTTLKASQPVLCASCHYSAALDLAHQGPQGEQVGKPYLSRAMHTRHGKTMENTFPDANNPPIISSAKVNACYYCHPGIVTKCLRGAMATAGVNCQNCHGGMLAVGGVYNLKTTGKPREPWKDLPKCQSCHTGDVLKHLGGATLIFQRAYYGTDPAATPRVALNQRFAENKDTLFRNSLGHHGVACQSCHGSPHAEWPARAGANDNIAAQQIQGHTGPIIECAACHGVGNPILGQGLPPTMDGPHGLHNINDPNWVLEHFYFAFDNKPRCMPCHGSNLEGSVLAKTAADRTLFNHARQPITFPKGTVISCTLCHPNPLTWP